MGELGDALAREARPDRAAMLGRVADLLERNGIDVDDIGRVNRVNLWQSAKRGDDGEWDVQDLVGVQLSPSWEDGPAWPVVQQAKPCVVRPVKAAPRTRDYNVCVVLPDPQIGYRRDSVTGELIAFHDESAMSVALQVLRHTRPNLVVNLGDTLDLPEMGRFRQEPAFALTTQAAVDRAHRWLAEQRAVAPDAEIRLIEGNHDRRLMNYIIDNARAAFGLRQANAPEAWPVMSVPFLLRLDELGITYVEGYPAGITWINDRLACVHGEKLKVSQVVDDERVSIIQGHTHHIATTYKTRRTRDGARMSMAATPGCLCRIDGSVPSTKGSTDSRGRFIERAEDWQQGLAVVHYQDGEGPFRVDVAPIIDGWCMVEGREFLA